MHYIYDGVNFFGVVLMKMMIAFNHRSSRQLTGVLVGSRPCLVVS